MYVTPPLPSPSMLYRVGFSKDGTTMNLGEASQSYGFGGTSKAITNSVFVDYGESFGPGDVIGCFVVRRGWGLQCVGVLTHNPPPCRTLRVSSRLYPSPRMVPCLALPLS